MDDSGVTFYQAPSTSRFLFRRLIFVIVMLVLIVAVVVVVIILLSSRQRLSISSVNAVEIVNYEELEIMPPVEQQTDLNMRLYSVLEQHFDVNQKMPIQGVVRPESLQSDYKNGLTTIAFIVDIDEFRQSYSVEVSWALDENTEVPNLSSVECVSRSLSKYPDEICYGMYYDSTSSAIYLPYTGQLTSGVKFLAENEGIDNYGVEHVVVSVQNCYQWPVEFSTSNAVEAVEAVKKYLKDEGGINVDSMVFRRIMDNEICN